MMMVANPFKNQLIIEFPGSPEYSFDNFVLSRGSEFAFNAIRSMASSEPVPYHSLFIAGQTGLGKTHLLMALGNHITKHQPEKYILFVSGPELVERVNRDGDTSIANLMDSIKAVDFFLMDEVDVLVNCSKAQEAVYSIYNSLKDDDKRIIFAGRATPQALKGAEDFLTSRFKWGMTAEIQSIDDASMMKIMKKLGKDLGLSLPDAVLNFLIVRIDRDFPSIRKAVDTINRESFQQKRKVTIPLVKSCLNME